MTLRVLTWNLFHGRAVPPAGRPLLDEFAATLAGWEWDVALLQEVPPWWPPVLAARAGAQARSVRTSRSGLLAVRRAVAVRAPDLIKSNGGGANAILVRGHDVLDHRSMRLCRLPERRWLHAVYLDGGRWVGNVHLSTRPAAARAEAASAVRLMREWAGGERFVLGGDFNVRGLGVPDLACAAAHEVDYVLVSDGALASGFDVLERGPLSDHAPLAVSLAR